MGTEYEGSEPVTLEVHHLKLRYRLERPLALKGVSFSVSKG